MLNIIDHQKSINISINFRLWSMIVETLSGTLNNSWVTRTNNHPWSSWKSLFLQLKELNIHSQFNMTYIERIVIFKYGKTNDCAKEFTPLNYTFKCYDTLVKYNNFHLNMVWGMCYIRNIFINCSLMLNNW